MDTFTCSLPGGYFDSAGVLHREAELGLLSGREEEWLACRSSSFNAVAVTQLLRRCVHRIGAVSPVTEGVARGLLVGDRQFLMLKLRAAMFGERVMATLVCPWEDCGKRIDIDFSLLDLPVYESTDKGPLFALELSATADQGRRVLVFRLPNGGDQEAVASTAAPDPERALTFLMGRCVESIDGRQAGELFVQELDTSARAEIDSAMAAVAPRVDANLHGLCPECGRPFTRPFDLAGFFFDELRIGRDQLYREVHCLAYHYHWSEAEILGLSRAKRRLYIEILTEQLERANHAFQ